jgi:RNA polymerase sigma factor for flagellar operon FliA
MDEFRTQRDARILALAPIVERYVSKYAKVVSPYAHVVDVDDLRAAAWSGAVNAVDRFDSTRGVPLEAYASVLIRGGVLNEIRAADPLGEKVRTKLRHARTTQDDLRAALLREPTPAEVAVSVPNAAALRAKHAQLPIATRNDDRDPLSIVTDGRSAEDIAIAHLTAVAIADSVTRLPAPERKVIDSHYFGDATLAEIAQGADRTPQRISQLHVRGLQRLRNVAGAAFMEA